MTAGSRFALVFLVFLVFIGVFVIGVPWRRHRIADEAQPNENALGESRGHIGPLVGEHGKGIPGGLAAWSGVRPVVFDARHTVTPVTN